MTICFVTTGQPTTNPRLVKEADACVEAGWTVHVIAAHWAPWATALDHDMVAGRPWAYTFIDWRRESSPRLFWLSRARHWLARLAAGRVAAPALMTAAASRIGPELERAARSVRADLFIAHNLGALPAASAAAAAQGARLGFDAEDFHSGQLSAPADEAAMRLTQAIERHFMPRCDYITAAAPEIAAAYHRLCGVPLPTTVLNVFPRSDRPLQFRNTRKDGPVRVYWFSQTIGADRGLEQAVRAIGLLGMREVQLHLRGAWQPGFEKRLRGLGAESGLSADQLVALPPEPAGEMVRAAAFYDIGLALETGSSINSDILVSNKVFTYILAGTAVVLTRTTGQQALLPELGAAAQGCDVGDPVSLADALHRWITDRDALDLARRTAWTLGERRFNWDVEKERFLSVIKRAGVAKGPGAMTGAPAA